MDSKEFIKFVDQPTKVLKQKYQKQFQKVLDSHKDFLECALDKIRPNYPNIVVEAEPTYRISNQKWYSKETKDVTQRVYFEYSPVASLRYSNSNADINTQTIYEIKKLLRDIYWYNQGECKKFQKKSFLFNTKPQLFVKIEAPEIIKGPILVLNQQSSDFYRRFKKHLPQLQYPGDEKKEDFIDRLLKIESEKPITESQGERLVRIFLTNKNVKFYPYHKFKECFSTLNNKCYFLTFDFYLPDLNILIEYDGEQHFRPVDIFGGQKTYDRQVILDNIKNGFANDNNIRLIRIPFTVKNDTQLIDYLPDNLLGLQ